MSVRCFDCSKGKEVMKRLLEEADSVFDAAYDMDAFIANCEKSCTYIEKNASKEKNPTD